MREKNILCALLLTSVGALGFSPNYYGTKSKLSEGKWVKICTEKEQIYQITYDELRAMGFANPENVQVYGYGACQLTNDIFSEEDLDDLTPYATLHTEDGRILFVGQGDYSVFTGVTNNHAFTPNPATFQSSFTLYRNFYDTKSYFFLTDAYGRTAVPEGELISATEGYNVNRSHIHAELYENEVQTPIDAGIGYHDVASAAGDSREYKVRVKNFRPTDCNPHVYGSFNYWVAAGVKTAPAEDVTIGMGDNDVFQSVSTTYYKPGTLSGYDYYSNGNGYMAFEPKSEGATLPSGDLTFTVQIPSSVSYTYVAIDRTILRYPRANILDAEDPALIFYTGNYEADRGHEIVIEQVEDPAHLHYWVLDDIYNITELPGTYDAEKKEVSYVYTGTTRKAMAFLDNCEYPSVTVVGEVANQDLHGMSTPNMVIITVPEFRSEAERLAEIHKRYQNMEVAVVLQSDVFNEFSSGSRDAMGYRRFVKMLYDRNPEKMKYLLLFGVGAYDNRCIELSNVDRLLTYQSTDADQTRNTVTSYCSDMYFGMLADDFNPSEVYKQLAQVIVGRIPCITPSQGNKYVTKVEKWFNGGCDPEVFGRVILMGGEADNNAHVRHSIEVREAIETANPDLTSIQLPVNLYVECFSEGIKNTGYRDVAIYELQRGAGYMTYSGHGSLMEVSKGSQWSTFYAANTNYDHPVFAMFSSCHQFNFDHLTDGLVETMLFNENGGAIAAVGASRDVLLAYNQYSCKPIAESYARSKPGDTYGEVYQRARQYILDQANAGALNSVKSTMTNMMAYNFGGDPAVPVNAPGCKVKLTGVNGGELVENTIVTPLSGVTFTGDITDESGAVLTDYNGRATITILDSPVTSTTYNADEEATFNPIDITTQYSVLTQAELPVESGHFSGEVKIGIPTTPDTSNRIVITARSEDKRYALSSFNGLVVTNSDELLSEGSGPRIEQFYLNNSDFESGDIVNSNIVACAVITPSENGLNVSSSGVYTHSRLTQDKVIQYDKMERYMVENADGTYTLTFGINNLTDGKHTLELVVTDNAGLSSRSIIEFMVSSNSYTPIITILEQPARRQATIEVSSTEGIEQSRLFIRDHSGNTVYTVSNPTFPLVWDLKDSEGKAVSNGKYTVSILLNNGAYYGHSEAVPFVVLK